MSFAMKWLDVQVKKVNLEARTIEGIANPATVDLSGELIVAEAWKKSLARWKKRGSRPKFIGYHNHGLHDGHSPVLGRIEMMKVTPEGLHFKAWFAETPLGNEHLYLYSVKAMDYFSVGFLPLERIWKSEAIQEFLKENEIKVKPIPDVITVEAEIIEISCVVIGMNLGALSGATASDNPELVTCAVKTLERLDLVAGIIPNMELVATLKDESGDSDEETFNFEDVKVKKGIAELGPADQEPEYTDDDPLMVMKRVIGFRNFGFVEDESAAWNGPAQIRAADPALLKQICTWFDSENADVKSSYKLPHHLASNKKAVWRGVRAAMGALLGARGGTKVPSSDRKGIYNHLKKHYAHWDKEAPDFKEYTHEEFRALCNGGVIADPVSVQLEADQETLRAIPNQLDDVREMVASLGVAIENRLDKIEKNLDTLKSNGFSEPHEPSTEHTGTTSGGASDDKSQGDPAQDATSELRQEMEKLRKTISGSNPPR